MQVISALILQMQSCFEMRKGNILEFLFPPASSEDWQVLDDVIDELLKKGKIKMKNVGHRHLK